ncbi:MAG: thioredoxin-dependent thiol peroxidase [Candidatus Moraniibacteriota bacterium]
MIPQPGKSAPFFTLPDQNGVERSLKNYLGGWVVLYFYPKDDTPGCTKEACSFRDGYADLKKEGISLIGVSADTVKSHLKFSKKFSLPFLLLSDEEKKVVERYGVFGKKKFMGREYLGIFRTTFLIDPNGIIAKVYEDVKPDNHAQIILHDFQILK